MSLGKHLDRGEKVLSSMGDFVSILIDGGKDHIIFKVLEDNDFGDGTFHLKLEIDIVPEEHILEFCDEHNIKNIHGRISEVIERGIIKRKEQNK